MSTGRLINIARNRQATRRILYVNISGGPQFAYVIGRLRELGEVHVMQPEALGAAEQRQLRAAVEHVHYAPDLPPGPALRGYLASLIRRIGAEVVVTFDEFTLEDVSRVAIDTGLRGPGPRVHRARSKSEIYAALAAHDLLKRRYVASADLADILQSDIPVPFVVKPAECCGSLGVFPVRTAAELDALPQRLAAAHDSVLRIVSQLPAGDQLRQQSFIREGLLLGDAECWFGPGTPFADYCSLEGLVLNGRFRPLAITQDFPLIPPFIESASFTPCTLPFEKQREIVDRIGPCIESLGLENCGTHTEIKLLADGEFAVIETAARFSGSGVIRQIETVFGINPIGELARGLIDPTHDFPLSFEDVYRRQRGAAATVDLLPVDADNVPWQECTLRQAPDVTRVIDHGSRAECSLYIDPGDVIRPLDPLQGVWNCFGKIFIEARDAATLAADVESIRANLKRLVT